MAFCHRITGVLKAETPIHIGSGSRTGVVKHSRDFITGAAIRGAVGTAIIKLVCRRSAPLSRHEECEHFDDCAYVRLFGEEFGKPSRVFFRYAYPIHIPCGGLFRPAPKDLYRCENPQCRKLYSWIAPKIKCDLCGWPVKRVRGYRCDRCGRIEETPVGHSMITSTAVERSKSSAAQVGGAGTLHCLDAVSAGAEFGLEVVAYGLGDEDLGLLRRAIERALPDEGLGGSKSRGLGKVVASSLKCEAVDAESLEERASRIDLGRIRVRLLSPMVLEGGYIDPPTLLEGARRAYTMAFREGKPALPELELKGWAADGELFSGWSLRWGRRREVKAAISAGSVFEFSCPVEDRALRLALSALEAYALGGYKPHGCGQLALEE